MVEFAGGTSSGDIKNTHVSGEPPILNFFGAPVVLIISVNEGGSANLAPMSSAFWLG
jgi:flavin reductase (DIM6/NTAB) family NADH-FMN oxidoreductase RutF